MEHTFMVSAVKGKSKMVTKEDIDGRIESVAESKCREEGGEYVHGYRRDDGFYVHGFCRKRNPAVAEIYKNYRESANSIKAENDLRKHGTKVHGGYTLSVGQLQDYFNKHDIPANISSGERRDKNGNLRLRWNRHVDSRETEYVSRYAGKEGVVKSHDGYAVWWVDEGGKRYEGKTKTVSEAKYEAERKMRE